MEVFLAGFFLIFIGVVIVMIATLIYGLPDSAGLIIFVGPIPIVLGVGEYSLLAILLAIVVTILSTAFFIVLRRQKVSGNPHQNSA